MSWDCTRGLMMASMKGLEQSFWLDSQEAEQRLLTWLRKTTTWGRILYSILSPQISLLTLKKLKTKILSSNQKVFDRISLRIYINSTSLTSNLSPLLTLRVSISLWLTTLSLRLTQMWAYSKTRYATTLKVSSQRSKRKMTLVWSIWRLNKFNYMEWILSQL